MKNSQKIFNLIERRLVLSYLNRFSSGSNFPDDLKSMKQFEKFFITKSDADKKVKELKEKHLPIKPEDLCWYEQVDVDFLYVYQLPPDGVSQPLYRICYVAEFLRRGYDDPVCLSGVYQIDDDGNESSNLMGYKKVEDADLIQGMDDIREHGIKGWGKLYIGGDRVYQNFNDLKNYVKKEIEKRDNDLIF
jgi:hypothetical protein